jgi:hypothetical protein
MQARLSSAATGPVCEGISGGKKVTNFSKFNCRKCDCLSALVLDIKSTMKLQFSAVHYFTHTLVNKIKPAEMFNDLLETSYVVFAILLLDKLFGRVRHILRTVLLKYWVR